MTGRTLASVHYTDSDGSERTIAMSLDNARSFAELATAQESGPLLHEVLVRVEGRNLDHAELWAHGEIMLEGTYTQVMKGLTA